MNRNKILIIDDELHTLKLLKILFEKQGYETHTLDRTVDVIAAIADVSPDMLLLDISMPEVDGFSVLKKLKQHSTFRQLPVIVLTSHRELDMKLKALELGAFDFLSKPFQKYELLYRVQNILNFKENHSYNGHDNRSLIDKVFDEYNVLEPEPDKNSAYAYTFKNIASLLKKETEDEFFRQLQQTSHVQRELLDSVLLCPRCSHYNLSMREVCPHCDQIIDADSQNSKAKCGNCNHRIEKTNIIFKCLNCGQLSHKQHLSQKKIYRYKRTEAEPLPPKPEQPEKQKQELPDGLPEQHPAPKKTAEISSPDSDELILSALKDSKIQFVALDMFEEKVTEAIENAQAESYNVTVMSIRFANFMEICKRVEMHHHRHLMKNILLVIKKFLRKTDLLSYKKDYMLLFMLPKIHLRMARILAERIREFLQKMNPDFELEIMLASYPEDGYNSSEILSVMELGLEKVEEKFIP